MWNISHTSSDHLPIFVEVKKYVPRQNGYRFRAKNAWFCDPKCLEVVQRSWNQMMDKELNARLCHCGGELESWGRRFLLQLKTNIQAQKDLISTLKGWMDTASVAELNTAKKHLHFLLQQQELYWKQRAKLFWLNEGDYDTRALHGYANGRKKKNEVIRLRGDDGEWHDKNSGIVQVILSDFQNLFTSEVGNMQRVLECVEAKVTGEDNIDLDRPFMREAVKDALFSMHPDKAPGEDGLNLGFFPEMPEFDRRCSY